MDDLIEQFYNTFNCHSTSAALLKSALSHSFRPKWSELLKNQSLPEVGWSDTAIEGFLGELAAMDANNFEGVVGMGEREGRIASNLIKKRHFG